MIENITGGKRPMIVQDVLRNEKNVLYINGQLLQNNDGESVRESWRIIVRDTAGNVGMYQLVFDFVIDDGWHRYYTVLTPDECEIIGGLK